MTGKTGTPAKRRRGQLAGGRPSKLDDDTVKRLEGAVRNLNPWVDAFRLAGIAESTGHRWRSEGEKDRKNGRNTPERRLVERLEKAESEGKALLSGRIMRATAWDPHLALKVLERRDPKHWGAKQQVDVRDVTPPTSPRSRVMAKLEAIEDRIIKAQRAGVIDPEPTTAGPPAAVETLPGPNE